MPGLFSCLRGSQSQLSTYFQDRWVAKALNSPGTFLNWHFHKLFQIWDQCIKWEWEKNGSCKSETWPGIANSYRNYVFRDIVIFLKKYESWRRGWALEISRGRLATPSARFRWCSLSQPHAFADAGLRIWRSTRGHSSARYKPKSGGGVIL